MGTDWEYTYAAWMTDMRISQESISDQLFKKGYTAFNKCVDAFCLSIVALIVLTIISIFLGL